MFMFLPLALATYYLVPFRFRSLVILAFSYSFYAWWRLDYLMLLVLVTVWTYAFGKRIYENPDPVRKRRLLIISLMGPLAALAYFKYFNFFVDSLSVFLNEGKNFSALYANIILPIGISFYVFQAVSYLVDIYRNDAAPSRNFVDFAAFKALFPQLVAGPVLRYKDLANQFIAREHSFLLFSEGCVRFFTGLAKKVLIADSVAPIADAIFAKADPTFVEAWLGAIAYSTQLYFDFSGYSSMAVGLGMMMGFRFIENFQFPYISRSITEFWRRWHLSLSAWLRDYLYIPLGGSRKGPRRTYVNLFVTMVLGGLWHGANWTFVLWGIWHGGLLVVERLLGVTQTTRRPPVAMFTTLILVMLGWVMFRATDVSAAIDMYRGLVGLNGFEMQADIAWQVKNFALVCLALGIVAAFTEPYVGNILTLNVPRDRGVFQRTMRYGSVASVIVCTLGLVSMLKLSADNDSPFLYFQF
nr:MBOAT family protein [Pararhizobium antarcticum]